MSVFKSDDKNRLLPSDTIRMKLYELFIECGGVIDSDESYLGVGEQYNTKVINLILMRIISMRKTNYLEYCQILSTLITDGYAFLELENVIGPLAKLLINCIDNKPLLFSQGDAFQHKRNISLFERINVSRDVKEFEYNLQYDNQLLLLKDLIIPVIAAFAEEINKPCNHIDAIHYDSLKNPKSAEILTRYNTEEDMQEIYWRMLRTASKENTKYHVITVLLNLYQHLLSENIDHPIEQAFNLYKYISENFGQNLGDIFFYEIARCIFCDLVRKIINNIALSSEEQLLFRKLDNTEYRIDEIKEDLIPKENGIPELFIYFIKNAKDDFNERFDLSKKMRIEFDRYLSDFDKRFKDYCLVNS